MTATSQNATANNPLNPLRDDASLTGGQPPSLDQLRDLQLPEPIGLWPPAPGWWVLGLVATGLLVWLGWWLISHYRRNRYRRYALQELQTLDRSDPQRWLQQLNQLLRRTALAAYPDQSVASLHGQPWLDFLGRSSRLDGFRQPLGQALVDGPYRPDGDINIAPLSSLARQWIKRHQRNLADAPTIPDRPGAPRC